MLWASTAWSMPKATKVEENFILTRAFQGTEKLNECRSGIVWTSGTGGKKTSGISIGEGASGLYTRSPPHAHLASVLHWRGKIASCMHPVARIRTKPPKGIPRAGLDGGLQPAGCSYPR